MPCRQWATNGHAAVRACDDLSVQIDDWRTQLDNTCAGQLLFDALAVVVGVIVCVTVTGTVTGTVRVMAMVCVMVFAGSVMGIVRVTVTGASVMGIVRITVDLGNVCVTVWAKAWPCCRPNQYAPAAAPMMANPPPPIHHQV